MKVLRRSILVGATVVMAGLLALVVAVHHAYPANSSLPGHPVCLRPPTVTIPAHPVVAFGDSITWGWTIHDNCLVYAEVENPDPSVHVTGPRDQTYPEDLSRLLRQPVLDYGVPGEETSYGLPRLIQVVARVHPSTVIILEGVNDFRFKVSPRITFKNLRRMIHAAKTRVIIATLLPTYPPEVNVNRQIHTLNARIRRLHGVQVVDLAALFAHRRYLIGSDGVHPSLAGNRLIARVFAQALRHPR
ncbi:MAG TPA: SGNH/GDSL hydrolase family protein [Chloroflexota bacterium]|nr:SGNH/GDSL hydrolase family protein [Chloroflexota bacterium]